MGRTRSQWSRRLLAGVAATLIAGGVAVAQPAPADPLGVSDIGVVAEVANATINPTTGTVDITWGETATVRPGTGTLVRAHMSNDGSIPQLSATLTINTGGQLDDDFELASGCSATDGAVSDTVVCNYGQLDPGVRTPDVYVAIETGATPTIVTTASGSGLPNSLAPDNDESDSVTTTVAQNSEFAFLTDGESASFTSGSGEVQESFTVPAGGTNGGGFYVRLYQGSSANTTCGGQPCNYDPQARADFVQVGGTATPTVANPLTMTVTYPDVKQTCNGLGGGSSCNAIYFLPTGVTAGDAQQVPKCSSYSPNGNTPVASSDPCLYGLTRAVNAAVTYRIALLKDIGFPLLK